ncbi:unnamed protein product [Lactuca virosa]|uniref:ubiquitinyl hydrolase 1 n=1 Tax=Lactuca virosa TaxID=75947 RepID=A0AAU9NS10_9ASTR|nr:unnamed protein product [Lactuca virosa]
MYPFTCFTSSDSSFIVLLLETTVFSTGFRRSFLSLFCKSTASINGLLPSSSFHGLMLFQATAFPTRPPPPPGKIFPTSPPLSINRGMLYHEVQESKLCAIHYVNTVLQGPFFSKFDLAALASDLDRTEHQMMLEGSAHHPLTSRRSRALDSTHVYNRFR